ncbi:HAD-IA family hydrolase [Lentzea sp. CA-135723]|uniref:HAD-IA family hydrolase n=1 Tax=Lentzea sp. CA-135723 TaxID=3239950 RepID=UPI003D8C9039
MKLGCEAVLFDMDGVLTDSTVAAERAWTQWASEYGVDPALVLSGLHGRRAADTVRMHVAAELWDSALQRINAIELADSGATEAIPGAVALVESLGAGWALVTSAPVSLLEARLAAVGIPLPGVVISGDSVSAGKPSPEGYLTAASKLGVPISRCVVFEDSGNGVAAGIAASPAGVVGVGVGALETPAEVVVADLRAVSWGGDGVSISGALRVPAS